VSISFLGISQPYSTRHVQRGAEFISSLDLNSGVINCSKCQINKKYLVNLEKRISGSGVYSHFVMNRGVDHHRSINSICCYNDACFKKAQCFSMKYMLIH